MESFLYVLSVIFYKLNLLSVRKLIDLSLSV
jgi:hypothetical protein